MIFRRFIKSNPPRDLGHWIDISNAFIECKIECGDAVEAIKGIELFRPVTVTVVGTDGSFTTTGNRKDLPSGGVNMLVPVDVLSSLLLSDINAGLITETEVEQKYSKTLWRYAQPQANPVVSSDVAEANPPSQEEFEMEPAEARSMVEMLRRAGLNIPPLLALV